MQEGFVLRWDGSALKVVVAGGTNFAQVGSAGAGRIWVLPSESPTWLRP